MQAEPKGFDPEMLTIILFYHQEIPNSQQKTFYFSKP